MLTPSSQMHWKTKRAERTLTKGEAAHLFDALKGPLQGDLVAVLDLAGLKAGEDGFDVVFIGFFGRVYKLHVNSTFQF